MSHNIFPQMLLSSSGHEPCPIAQEEGNRAWLNKYIPAKLKISVYSAITLFLFTLMSGGLKLSINCCVVPTAKLDITRTATSSPSLFGVKLS